MWTGKAELGSSRRSDGEGDREGWGIRQQQKDTCGMSPSNLNSDSGPWRTEHQEPLSPFLLVPKEIKLKDYATIWCAIQRAFFFFFLVLLFILGPVLFEILKIKFFSVPENVGKGCVWERFLGYTILSLHALDCKYLVTSLQKGIPLSQWSLHATYGTRRLITLRVASDSERWPLRT